MAGRRTTAGGGHSTPHRRPRKPFPRRQRRPSKLFPRQVLVWWESIPTSDRYLVVDPSDATSVPDGAWVAIYDLRAIKRKRVRHALEDA